MAEIEWLTASTFRLRRALKGELPARSGPEKEAVTLRVRDSAAELSFETRYLLVALARSGLLVQVRKLDGSAVMADLSEARIRDGVISWERAAPEGIRYYGLGARGAAVETKIPFLISTAGYGEHHVASGAYTFDLARARRDRYRIEIRGSGLIDYYFFYGPTPKEILEERLPVAGVPQAAGQPGWTELAQAGMSGIFFPAKAISRLLPPEFSRGLPAYFLTYAQEMQTRGLPIVRPMPLQFPYDAQAAGHPGQFMLGDELLLAPGQPRVYLPMGTWTDLRSNERHPGRRLIAPGSEFPVYARNGTIVPLGSEPMVLHYFPRLGAEFFLFEDDLGEYSQVHAAPAGDFMRLEIESKKEREYEWVVHHLDRPRKVLCGEPELAETEASELRDGTWHYDAVRKSLHVRVRVAAGQDHIVNLSF